MLSSGMLRRVALVRTMFRRNPPPPSSAIIRLRRIGELGTTLSVTSNRRTLGRNTIKEEILLKKKYY
jgi:hypothetical protein